MIPEGNPLVSKMAGLLVSTASTKTKSKLDQAYLSEAIILIRSNRLVLDYPIEKRIPFWGGH